MPPPESDYHFAAPVLRSDVGMKYHYVPLPAAIADALQAQGVRRLAGAVNGHPFRRAIQGRNDGERYLIFGQAALRAIGAQLGDTVTVVLGPDPEPDRIDLGEELSTVLEQDEEAAARFASFPPGRQRSLAHYVTSAKRSETRITRALDLAHKLKTHTLYGDRRAGD